MAKKKNWSQGIFTPKFPEKYLGDPTQIHYRSSWELYFNTYIDANPNVIKWASEEIEIPYLHPFYNQIRTYYPDYFVEYVDTAGRHKKEIIEVKPENQIKLAKNAKRAEQETYLINLSKWDSCKKFCDKYGIDFRIVSEKQLFR